MTDLTAAVAELADKSLLVLDDDAPLRTRLGRALEQRGFEPILVATVAEAVAAVKIKAPAYAVLDLRLEDGSGLTVVEAIHAARPDARVVMLTGDHASTAQRVAMDLNIDEVVAGVTPEEKLCEVYRARDAGRKVVVAGDGINDAPALAAAQVGIAMGTGTDVAMQSADITLMKGDLGGILQAFNVSRATMKIIRQNLWFAFLYNGLGIPLAAGVLYPLTGWLLSPMIASAAMSLSSLCVILNSLRLRSVGA